MIQRICEQCKRPFIPNPRQAKQQQEQQRFCSIQCRNVANTRTKPRVKGVPCAKCGRIGYNRKSATCAQCSNRWTPDQIAYLQAHYATDGAQKVAEHLGHSLLTVRTRANKMKMKLNKSAAHRIVHSQAKAYMLKSNPMKRPEVAQKARQWHKDNPEQSKAVYAKLLEGQQRIQRDKPSKLEARLRAILDTLGVAYEPSALIKPKFVVDIRIGQLIIQADGEYWHGHPRFDPLTDRQRAQQKRDAAQTAYLHACGYTVVRIWERDVTTEHVTDILHQHGLF